MGRRRRRFSRSDRDRKLRAQLRRAEIRCATLRFQIAMYDASAGLRPLPVDTLLFQRTSGVTELR